jgi:aromatic ring-opening dioxygenase LigB subunit
VVTESINEEKNPLETAFNLLVIEPENVHIKDSINTMLKNEGDVERRAHKIEESLKIDNN